AAAEPVAEIAPVDRAFRDVAERILIPAVAGVLDEDRVAALRLPVARQIKRMVDLRPFPSRRGLADPLSGAGFLPGHGRRAEVGGDAREVRRTLSEQGGQQRDHDFIAAMIASVICVVDALPPRSKVTDFRSRRTCWTARETRSAARCSLRCSSISTAERTSA